MPLSPPRPSPLQKLLTDASEEVAKREQLHAFTQGKAAKQGSSPPKPLAEPERNVGAMQAEEEVSMHLILSPPPSRLHPPPSHLHPPPSRLHPPVSRLPPSPSTPRPPQARGKLREVAAIYAAILVKHTNYSNTQQERAFFETLYDFSARVLFTINDRKRWHAIENELGRVFRSEHFNLSIRKNETQVVKPMKSKDMYEAKLREDPMARPPATMKPRSSIHAAMAMRSPVISTLFPTPKDSMLRAAELRQTAQALSLEAHSSLPPSERQTPGSPPQAMRGASGGGASFGGSFRGGGGGGAPEMRERTASSGATREDPDRTKHLTSEEVIDAEIEQAEGAFNELIAASAD